MKLFSINRIIIQCFYVLFFCCGTSISFSQSKDSATVYIYKPKGSGVGKATILLNGQAVGELKAGKRITCRVASEGSYTIGMLNTSSENGIPKGLTINVSRGMSYYVKLYTNVSYRMLLKKENKYTGEQTVSNTALFDKKNAEVKFTENAKSPLVETNFVAFRSTDTEDVTKSETITSSSELPSITIIQPAQAEIGEVFKTSNSKIVVKGKITKYAEIKEVKVNGKQASLNSNGYFNCEVALERYMNNDISIVAFTKDQSFVQKEFEVYREISEVESFSNKRLGKDYALLIANNEYEDYSTLTNPVYDATRIKQELEQLYGFQTDFVKNSTLREVYIKLKEYSKKEFSDDDQLFIFIAGHGEFDPYFVDGYTVCKDSKIGDESKSTFLSHSNLRTIINNIPCKHIFLVMDVCFGGTFDQLIAHRGSENYKGMDNSEFISRKMKYKTRIYMTSGGKEYVPDGRPGHHSPFAHNFIEGLSSGGGEDKILTVSELMRYVEKTSPEPRKGSFGNNQPGSDFLFILK